MVPTDDKQTRDNPSHAFNVPKLSTAFQGFNRVRRVAHQRIALLTEKAKSFNNYFYITTLHITIYIN